MNIYKLADGYEQVKKSADRHSLLQIQDNRSMIVECCHEILIFNENTIVMRLPKCNITIVGLGLTMQNFSGSGVIIKGSFHSVSFEERTEKQ